MVRKTSSPVVKEKIEDYSVVDHLEQSFIDYSMSVITDRAIPDIRDGLKPSQRKALFTMRRMKLTPDKKTVKEQSVIGDCMKTVYVHGDAGLKGAIDRMAQFWVMNQPLVYPGGSVGTPDTTTEAAAARYLEVKLTNFGALMTDLLDKKVVNMSDNYDGTMKEPDVLPSLFPNILVNPSSGIAVGMATQIPSHNLIEACDATIAYLKNNDISFEELVKIIPGPDFPLGGTIVNGDDMIDCYKTGKGKAIVRGTPVINKNIISFKEIPYGVGTNKIVDKILNLIDNDQLPGVDDAYDNTGIDKKTLTTTAEVCIKLEPGADVNKVLELLYLNTPLQSSISFNMMALVDKTPKLLDLKSILKHYSNHLCDVHRRSIQYDLDKEEHNLHILNGLRLAIMNLDKVIEIIKSSQDKADGLIALMSFLKIDEEQAEAIWNRRLGSLSKMNVKKIDIDIQETQSKVDELKGYLSNLIDYVINSLNEVKKLGTPRKTKIVNIDLSYQKEAKAPKQPTIEEEQIVIGFNKATHTIKQAKRGAGFKCSNLDPVYLFTKKGNFIKIKGYEVPTSEKERIEALDIDDEIVSFVQFNNDDDIYHITKKGSVKRTKGIEYLKIVNKNTKAIKLKDDDEVIEVFASNKDKGIIRIVTSTDSTLDLNIEEIPVSRKLTSGRKKIEFEKNETIKSINILETA